MKAQVLALTVIISLAILFQLPNPSPTPGKAADTQESHTQTEHGKGDSKGNLPNPLASGGSNEHQDFTYKRSNKPPTDWWAMFNSLVVTLATAAIAYLAHRQRQAMDRQAEAMDKQAKSMQDSLRQARLSVILQGRAIRKQSDDSNRIFEQTRKSADAAVLSAETAKKALEMLERADLIIDEIVFVKTSTSYDNYITISVKNVGRSRATNASVSAKLLATHDELILGNYVMVTAVAPGSAVEICRCDFRQAPWMDLDRAWKLTSGEEAMMIDFTIYFTDIFEQNHAVEGTASHTPWKQGQPFAILYKS